MFIKFSDLEEWMKTALRKEGESTRDWSIRFAGLCNEGPFVVYIPDDDNPNEGKLLRRDGIWWSDDEWGRTPDLVSWNWWTSKEPDCPDMGKNTLVMVGEKVCPVKAP